MNTDIKETTAHQKLLMLPIGVAQVALFNNLDAAGKRVADDIYTALKAAIQIPQLKHAELKHLMVAALSLAAEAASFIDEQQAEVKALAEMSTTMVVN